MEAQDSTYVYTPLDNVRREIRLLHILPKYTSPPDSASPAGEVNPDTIRCVFSRTTLDDPTEFEALSYVWGDASNKQLIQLEGHAFQVTQNLHHALTHLRQDYEERICWVDALCINQGDTDERSSQVSQMEYIYRLAVEVIVFLGPRWEGQEIAIDFIEAIASDKDLHYSPLQQPHVTSHGLDGSSELLCRYIVHFFALPWWTRAWTVQEYALARRVTFMCGMQIFPGRMLSRYLAHINEHWKCCLQGSRLHWRDKMAGLTVWESQTNASALVAALGPDLEDDFLYRVTRFRFRGCYDARDQIYSVLGLASPEYRELIKVSYTTPTAKVLISMAVASIEVTNSLDILSHVCGSGHPLLSTRLPSCVPDWTSDVTIMQREPFIQRLKMLHGKPFKASRRSQAAISITNNIAGTVAMVIDKIQEVAAYAEAGSTWEDKIPQLRQLGRIDKELSKPYESRENAFWKTLCGGLYPGGLYNHAGEHEKPFHRIRDEHEHMYRDWLTWCTLGISHQTEGADIFGHAVMCAAACRRFILTEKGYIGWAAEDCQVGDEVVLMPGGRVPYILRPFEAEGPITRKARLYQFIGDAYIHGVMDGEAWLDPDELHPIIMIPRNTGDEDEDEEADQPDNDKREEVDEQEEEQEETYEAL
jgi:hypothetical protein